MDERIITCLFCPTTVIELGPAGNQYRLAPTHLPVADYFLVRAVESST